MKHKHKSQSFIFIISALLHCPLPENAKLFFRSNFLGTYTATEIGGAFLLSVPLSTSGQYLFLGTCVSSPTVGFGVVLMRFKSESSEKGRRLPSYGPT